MELKPGYTQTEVGLIPEVWTVVSLGFTARGIYRGASPRPIENPIWFDDTSKVGWVRISDVTRSGRQLVETTQRLSKDGIQKSRFIPSGSLIMSICATVGRPIETQIDVCIHDGFVVFDRPLIDQGYLYHVLKDLEPRWSSKGQTGSQMNLNGDLIKSTLIPLPPTKAEQESIAEALSDADALIESLDQLIAKKREIKQGAMQELLTGKRRLPGFSGEWEAKRLGDVAHLYQPTTISAQQFTAAGYPVYGANGVVGYFDNFNHSTWQVIVTCRGSTCGTVNRTVNKCWITGNSMVIGCDGNASISKEFLYYALSFCDLSTCITGTGQPQIVRAPLANFEIRVPIEVFEQSAIVTILSDMDTELAALESRLAKARQIKQGMMQELLTGRIRLL